MSFSESEFVVTLLGGLTTVSFLLIEFMEERKLSSEVDEGPDFPGSEFSLDRLKFKI